MITDQMLAEAAAELNIAMLNSLPDAAQTQHRFSENFERKMRRIIRKGNHPVRYRVMQRVASLILILFLSFMTLIAVSPTVRASVLNWVREKHEQFTHYYLTGSANQDTVPANYELTYIPSGYKECKRVEQPGSTTIFYANYSTNEIMYFTYSKNHNSVAFFLDDNNYTIEDITISGEKGDLYLSKQQGNANFITWADSQTNTFLGISAFADKDELIKISENIKKFEN